MIIDTHIQQLLNLTQQQFDILFYIWAPLEVLSLLLCLFTSITYITFKNKFPARLVLFNSLCVCLNHAVDVWLLFAGTELFYNTKLCVAQGVLEQFSSLGCVLWWCCISVNMCLSFVMRVKMHLYEKYMLLGWLCICVLTSGLAYNRIGAPQGLLCWIDSPEWQFLLYYMPMFICLCVGGGFSVATIYRIKRVQRELAGLSQERVGENLPSHIIRQTAFVVWFFFLFLFFFCHRLYIYIETENGHNKHGFTFAIAAIIAQSTPGTFIFLIFGLKIEHWKMWREKFLPRDVQHLQDCIQQGYDHRTYERRNI